MVIKSCEPVELTATTPAIPREGIPASRSKVTCHPLAILTGAVALQTMGDNYHLLIPDVGIFQPIKVNKVAIRKLKSRAHVISRHFSECTRYNCFQVAVKQEPNRLVR